METLGWNPLLEERSQASSLIFPGFAPTARSSTTTTVTTARPSEKSAMHPHHGHYHSRVPPQSANYPRRNSVKFSFNLSEFGDEVDNLLALPSPAISISPGVFFDDPFNFPPQSSSSASSTNPNDNSQQRSPSLGIGSSLGTEILSGDQDFRPSSVAHFSFPKCGADLPYDNARAKSAVPAYQRPSSSADWHDDDSNESPVDEDSEHWTDWNIKTAPGCPPLDQLFENKRRWREKFNQSVPPPLQRHCVFCKSISKPPSIYLSHAIRDAKGDITCPVLNAYSCPKCGKRGHTVRYCALNQSQQSSASTSSSSQPSPPLQGQQFSFNMASFGGNHAQQHQHNVNILSSRLGSVGSMSEAIAMMGGRCTKSALGFY